MTDARILIIDDDRDVCRVLSRELMDLGYHVSYVLTGKDGVNKVRKNYFDVVILDLKLPDLQGIEVLRRIREFNNTVKILVLTGNPSFESAIETIRNEVADYITKPYDSGYLKTKLKKVLKDKRTDKEVLLGLKELGMKIRELRTKRNVTLTEFANKLQLSKSFISELERGKKFATVHTLTNIAHELNVDLKFLVHDPEDFNKVTTG
jgi:DNA-binding response OmpR family regulator